MLVGYSRVSTVMQSTDVQVSALRAAGCGMIFSENVSGTKSSRPEWDKALAALQPGDSLVVTKLDRAGRSLKHLLKLSERLDEMGCTLIVTEQGIDTSTSAGRAFYAMVGIFAELEASLVSERTTIALQGRRRGRNGGRPKALSPRALARAQALYDSKSMTLVEVAAAVGVSKATLCRHLTLDGTRTRTSVLDPSA